METENASAAAVEVTEKPKTEKKKLLVVNPRIGDSQTYNFGYNNLHVAFVSGEEHNRTQCSSFITCREYINRCVLSHLTKNKFFDGHRPGTDVPIDTNKLRLLLATALPNTSVKSLTDFKQNLFNAKAGINRYEELAGWKKSVICTVKHKTCKGNVWMITSPNEWMSQPQLLSTFILLLRFICMHPTIDTNSIDTIHSSMITAAKKYEEAKHKNKGNFVHDGDLEARFYNEDIILKYAFVVENAKTFFEGIDMEKAWPASATDAAFVSTSGIDKFIKGEAVYSDTVKLLQKTFADIWNARKDSIVEDPKEVS